MPPEARSSGSWRFLRNGNRSHRPAQGCHARSIRSRVENVQRRHSRRSSLPRPQRDQARDEVRRVHARAPREAGRTHRLRWRSDA
jgi:hypothetical protein